MVLTGSCYSAPEMESTNNGFANLTRWTACLILSVACPAPAQTTLSIEPGLTIPNDDTPWTLDTFRGKHELVPVHHTTANINNHTGANIAGSLAGSFFYKPKITTELPGPHARTVVHDPRPAFYLRSKPVPDDDGNPKADAAMTGWAIVHGVAQQKKRVFQEVRITQLTNHGERKDSAVDSTQLQLPGDWIKITPKEPLEPGEYAIVPLFRGQKFMTAVLFDFTVDPAAPSAGDAVLPTTQP